VRIIARPRIEGFWRSRKSDRAIAERDLLAWYRAARKADWDNWGSLKQTFGSADQVGNCVVFDVGNNRYRLIGRVNYRRGVIYVLKVMDHAEYDRKAWVDACGCHKPPPQKPPAAKEASPEGSPAPRARRGGK
jgi:mRNA interferase HigB